MTYRTDIQALRGRAVLQVIAFHAGHGFVQAGYLGVDYRDDGHFSYQGSLVVSRKLGIGALIESNAR